MCKFGFFIEVHILHTRDTRVSKELSKICLQYCTISNCPRCSTACVWYILYAIMLYYHMAVQYFISIYSVNITILYRVIHLIIPIVQLITSFFKL